MYVCHRPLRDMGNAGAQTAHAQRLQHCFRNNLCGNHSGERIFRHHYNPNKYDDNIVSYLDDPTKVYTITGLRPRDSPEVRALLGYTADSRANAFGNAGSKDSRGKKQGS